MVHALLPLIEGNATDTLPAGNQVMVRRIEGGAALSWGDRPPSVVVYRRSAGDGRGGPGPCGLGQGVGTGVTDPTRGLSGSGPEGRYHPCKPRRASAWLVMAWLGRHRRRRGPVRLCAILSNNHRVARQAQPAPLLMAFSHAGAQARPATTQWSFAILPHDVGAHGDAGVAPTRRSTHVHDHRHRSQD